MSRTSAASATVVRLRIVVTNPPIEPDASFGVQDKSGDIRPGAQTATRSVVFECDITASHAGERAEPNFLGPYTHGPPTGRFIYVSHGTRGRAGWIKRIKIPLTSINWSMVKAARDGALETEVDGRSSGTVRATWRPVD